MSLQQMYQRQAKIFNELNSWWGSKPFSAAHLWERITERELDHVLAQS